MVEEFLLSLGRPLRSSPVGATTIRKVAGDFCSMSLRVCDPRRDSLKYKAKRKAASPTQSSHQQDTVRETSNINAVTCLWRVLLE